MLFGRRNSKFKVGIALSGGGTLGFAHVGVLQAFAECGITFDCIAGTSAGSLFGCMYAAGIPWDEVLTVAKQVKKKDILNKTLLVGSKSGNIQALAHKLLGDITFDQLKIPMSAVAVDIVTGDEVILDSGNVAEAVSASCAVPVLFTPVTIGERLLVDGGLLNNMPADVCRLMGADIVIGVDLNSSRGKGTTSRKIPNTLLAMWNITTKSTMYKGYHNADEVVQPNLTAYKNTDLNHIDEMVAEGYRATMEIMPQIKQLLQIR